MLEGSPRTGRSRPQRGRNGCELAGAGACAPPGGETRGGALERRATRRQGRPSTKARVSALRNATAVHRLAGRSIGRTALEQGHRGPGSGGTVRPTSAAITTAPLRPAAMAPASTVPGASGFRHDAAAPPTLGVARGRRADMRRWNSPGGQASRTFRNTTPAASEGRPQDTRRSPVGRTEARLQTATLSDDGKQAGPRTCGTKAKTARAGGVTDLQEASRSKRAQREPVEAREAAAHQDDLTTSTSPIPNNVGDFA